MTALQAFCCSIGPALSSLIVGYVTVRLASRIMRDQSNHNDFD